MLRGGLQRSAWDQPDQGALSGSHSREPLLYLANFYYEARLFLTHSDTGALEIETPRLERQPFFTQTFSPVDGCKHEIPEWTDIQPIESWVSYTCTYGVDKATPLRRALPDLYDAMLISMQPYRLEGVHVWSRFWAALALIAFALSKGRSASARW
jgi:hypothetical protein